jgi:cytochrome c553
LRSSIAALAGVIFATVAVAQDMTGERLAYVVGCINCHHQTPKEIMPAPPLAVVNGYTLPEFRVLMKSGVARSGRNLVAESSVMGIVAQEQFSYLTDAEIDALYHFLHEQWTPARAAEEEAKIPRLYKAGPET